MACGGGPVTCQSGVCVDMTSSCQDLWKLNPTAATGMYTLLDGSNVFCDAATQSSFSGVYYGQFNGSNSGFQMVTAADLQNPARQAAFIAFFNAQGGAKLVTAWSLGNCCAKVSQTAGMYLFLGSGNSGMSYVETGPSGATCASNTPALGDVDVWVTTTLTVEAAPLSTSFFTTFPAREVATNDCDDSSNPAFFWKVP